MSGLHSKLPEAQLRQAAVRLVVTALTLFQVQTLELQARAEGSKREEKKLLRAEVPGPAEAAEAAAAMEPIPWVTQR